MTHDRLASFRRFAEDLTADRHVAPADKAEALFGDNFFDDGFFVLALFVVARKEHEADPVVAFCRDVESAFCLADALKEIVRQLYKDTRTISGDRIATTTTAVIEIHADLQRTLDDVMGFATFHIDDKADAAVFMFMLRIVETLCLGLKCCLIHV